MDVKDWEIFRHIEMEIIKEEIDREIAKEKWKEILNNNFNIDLHMSTLTFIVFYIGLFICLVTFVLLIYIDFSILYKILEFPYLKPVFIVSIPAYFGIKSYRKDKIKMKKKLKRCKKSIIKKIR